MELFFFFSFPKIIELIGRFHGEYKSTVSSLFVCFFLFFLKFYYYYYFFKYKIEILLYINLTIYVWVPFFFWMVPRFIDEKGS